MNKMWLSGFVLILLSLAGAFYPVLFTGTKDPFVILEVTLGSLNFWIFAIIGTIGAFLCYHAVGDS